MAAMHFAACLLTAMKHKENSGGYIRCGKKKKAIYLIKTSIPEM